VVVLLHGTLMYCFDNYHWWRATWYITHVSIGI